jgi:hypothetical protein
VRSYLDAGFDEIYIQQIGPAQDAFFDFWHRQVHPAIRSATPVMSG